MTNVSRHIDRTIGLLASAVTILIIAVAGLVIGLNAQASSSHVTGCVNAIGARDVPNTADRVAQQQFLAQLSTAWPQLREDPTAVDQLKAATDQYLAALQANDSTRAAHPLTPC